MNLSPYVATVREGVENAASLADEQSQQIAHKLGTALESSTRLALIQALSDAASDISADLAPGSVELRMAGADPSFVVTVPQPSEEPTLLVPESEPAPAEPEPEVDADEPVARISLRLPNSIKVKVDEVAAAEGISTNAWLMRAVMETLSRSGQPQPPQPPLPPGPGGVFGPEGPFGPKGPFGPNGPFGPGGTFGGQDWKGRNRNRDRGVQGWAR